MTSTKRKRPTRSRAAKRLPRGVYGDQHDGLGDPDRPSMTDRMTKSVARIEAERRDRASLSPTVRKLRAVTAAALGGRRGGRLPPGRGGR